MKKLVIAAIVLTVSGVSAQAPNITGKWVFDVQTDAGRRLADLRRSSRTAKS